MFGTNDSNVENAIGFTDEAALEDKFKITDYIGGLARFIEECNTPMTISIQGSWGTGKTSIMNLVQKELTKSGDSAGDVLPVWFNTWQFSQFNMSEQLPLSLLSGLIAKFEIEDSSTVTKAQKILKGLQAGYGLFKAAGLGLISNYLGEDVADAAKKGVDKLESNISGDNKTENDFSDPALSIIKLKDEFEACIDKVLFEKKKKRIVFFIDDLDRLNPGKAVELLEVLKLFLDCKKCVYVLAIDYDVVCRGVEAKYGSLADDKKAAEEKGRSFFDKIIQVPFKMPIAKYDISGYVGACLSRIGINLTTDDEKSIYVSLIKNSIGTNPRSMKRLFNAFQLLLKVVPKDIRVEEKNRQLLFAILCLHHCSEAIYNFMVRNSDVLTVEMFETILNGEYEKFSELVETNEIEDELTENDISSARPFLEKLKAAIDKDGNHIIDEEKEFKVFKEIMDWTSITNATDNEAQPGKGERIIFENLSELKLYGNTPEDVEHIGSVIRKFGEDIVIQPTCTKKGTNLIRVKVNNGRKTFVEVYGRQKGYAMDVIAPDGKYYEDTSQYSEIVQQLNKLGIKPYASNSKLVTKVIHQGESAEAEEEKLIELGKMVYNAWTKNI